MSFFRCWVCSRVFRVLSRLSWSKSFRVPKCCLTSSYSLMSCIPMCNSGELCLPDGICDMQLFPPYMAPPNPSLPGKGLFLICFQGNFYFPQSGVIFTIDFAKQITFIRNGDPLRWIHNLPRHIMKTGVSLLPYLSSMPKVGIEPTFLTEHDFESCASAYSATSACLGFDYT